MSFTIHATFEQGVLKPKEPLTLKEHQAVKLIIIEEQVQPVSETRLAEMTQQVEAWLAAQPTNAVHEPEPMTQTERARLDKELDDLLAELRQQSANFTEEEIAADVDEAMQFARFA